MFKLPYDEYMPDGSYYITVEDEIHFRDDVSEELRQRFMRDREALRDRCLQELKAEV